MSEHEHGHAPAHQHGHKHHEHAHDGKACTHNHEVPESHSHDSKPHAHEEHGHDGKACTHDHEVPESHSHDSKPHAHEEHGHDGKACTHDHEVPESHSHDSKPRAHDHKEKGQAGHGHEHEHDVPLSCGVITASSLEDKLRASSLAPSYVSVTDESDGCGSKFSSVVVSESFEGMTLIDRHRAIQDFLGAEIAQIHAFQVKAWTAAQYEKKKATGSVS